MALEETSSTLVNFLEKLSGEAQRREGESWHGCKDASDENSAAGDGQHFPFPACKPSPNSIKDELKVNESETANRERES